MRTAPQPGIAATAARLKRSIVTTRGRGGTTTMTATVSSASRRDVLSARLAMLDQRIATVERELAATGEQNARPNGDGATLGDVVTLNFGDGPAFLLGSIDEAVDGLDVITPNSPLGRALQARAPARPSPTRRARTAPSGQPLSPSAERAPQVGIRAADAVTSARSGSSDSRKTRSWRPLSVDSA